MAKKRASKEDRRKAKELEKQGIEAYQAWDIEKAVRRFRAAARAIPDESEYLLHLARALARSGDFDQALRALANFMRLEPESPLSDRFEQLFASGLDKVEQLLTEKATASGLPIEVIGAAIQMWLEYRITLGRETLIVRKPQTWAAALDYTVRKVNLHPVKRKKIAALYGISEGAVRDRHNDLVNTLDVMPCDYRYFAGKENPLDKLVEAAEMLEELENSFREP
jgi:tetratricopeptide (TPR) repeat protein